MSLSSRELKYELKNLLKKVLKALPGLVSVGLGVIAVILWASGVGRGFDISAQRFCYSLRGVRPVPPELILVGIDDESFKAFNLPLRTALPRKYFADAIEEVAAAKPKLVIIDASIPPEDFDPASNARIVAALNSIPAVIGAGTMNTNLPDKPFITIPSDEQFRKAVKYEMPMLMSMRDGVASQLSSDSKDDALLEKRAPLALPLQTLAGYTISTPGPFDLINFYGPSGTIPRISFSELTTSENIQSRLSEKVVFLGFQTLYSPGTRELDKEEFSTSHSSHPMFGVEIHASIVGNLIESSWLRRWEILNEVTFVFVVAVGLGLIGLYISPEKASWIVALLVIVAFVAQYQAFLLRWWLPGIPTLAIIGVLSVLLGVLYRLSQREQMKRFIARVFGIKLS